MMLLNRHSFSIDTGMLIGVITDYVCILGCAPSEGFWSIGHHSYTQLDGLTDGEG